MVIHFYCLNGIVQLHVFNVSILKWPLNGNMVNMEHVDFFNFRGTREHSEVTRIGIWVECKRLRVQCGV